MMMIVHDARGVISQLIATGDFDLLKQRYEEIGMRVLCVEPTESDVSDLLAGSYVADGRIRNRPNMTLKTRGDAIDGIPPGCMVTVNLVGHTVGKATVDDGTMEFETPVPGVYTLQLECWPYVPTQMELVR